MRVSPLRLACVLTFVWFASFVWIKSIPSDDALTDCDLQMLFERLLVVKELEGQLISNISNVMERLANMSKVANVTNLISNSTTNHTSTSSTAGEALFKLGIDLLLPHLKQHPDSLVPNVVLGKGRRGVSIVLGIPTVKREQQSYLTNTVSSLLSSLTTSQRRDILIVIFVAETDSDYVKSVAQTILKNFTTEVESGLLEVVSPSQNYYPDFNNLEETLGDSKTRVRWRSKQSMDFSFLMLYAHNRGTFYVQLEDDIIAKDGYYSDMKSFATQNTTKQWLYLEFSQLGFIGKMFHAHDLPLVAQFFLMFHNDKPVDWLLDHILWVKVCNPEKPKTDCDQQMALLKRRHEPSLFQHVGLHSSLPGKMQNLKDLNFGRETLYWAHSNPFAELHSSLKHYSKHSLDRVYGGQGFFWAITPVHGDYILFRFPQPIYISGYLFRSGNIKNERDIFHNTTVEVLPGNAFAKKRLLNDSSSLYKDEGFVVVGAFQNGAAEGEIGDELQPVSALRLVVHSDSDVWVLLSEVHIKV
ncbi:alpha-1,3-mannosyl-glycoprotein 4-beta-N-acetylglucosaminyltransferase B isoform 1-T1 [Menidia menidia]